MTDTRLTRTFGNNNPIHSHPAAWDGHRSVRLMGENFNLGLATTAYSYALSYDELTEVAERIALLWNLHLGDSTDDLRNPSLETKPADSRPLDEASLPTTSRLSQLEVRKSCAASVNDPLTLKPHAPRIK